MAGLEPDGFVHISALVDDAGIERLRTAADRLEHVSSGPYGSICHDPWRRDPTFMELAVKLGLGALACEVTGAGELAWFQDHLIAKPPGGEAAIAWHQDYSYWPLDRCGGVTSWIALDDAGVAEGCLAYVPGSHRGGERRPADFAVGAQQPPRLQALAPIVEAEADRRARPIAVRAGDAVFHHPLLWHRSGPNRGAGPRRAWSISWIDPAARWDPEHAPHPFVRRLADPGAELDPERFPRFGGECCPRGR